MSARFRLEIITHIFMVISTFISTRRFVYFAYLWLNVNWFGFLCTWRVCLPRKASIYLCVYLSICCMLPHTLSLFNTLCLSEQSVLSRRGWAKCIRPTLLCVSTSYETSGTLALSLLLLSIISLLFFVWPVFPSLLTHCVSLRTLCSLLTTVSLYSHS